MMKRMNAKFCLSALLLLPWLSLAQSQQLFSGVAKKGTQVLYTEKHDLTVSSDDRVTKAVTTYIDTQQNVIAKMNSDFTESLTTPNYEFENFKIKNKHGIRRQNGSILLFDKDEKKSERTKLLEDGKDKHLLVGGQGLNYYILSNFTEILEKKALPVRLLVPGKLDYFDFILKVKAVSEDGNVSIELKVESWFLRLFAPSFEMKYNKNTKRLLYYKGLSNLPAENGDIQIVEINYDYPPK